MINIQDKHNCCGCKACIQRCPKTCISLVTDECGFYYPKVDLDACIHCGLCEAVCPIIHQDSPRLPIKQYWGINKDEALRMSSSGGIFIALATRIINQGGYVIGAVFNNQWLALHQTASSLAEISIFKGSKYLQSDIGRTFLETEKLLKAGTPVLFSGTPCQISGLKRFLRKSYDNLLCVDIVCHGIPSPKVWVEYLKSLVGEEAYPGGIDYITFKDKSDSWSKYALNIRYRNTSGENLSFIQSTKENPYTVCFLRNYTIRPSCFKCPAKAGKSGSDITLGDFWGVNSFYPELNDEKGASVILCYTEKGYETLKSLDLSLKEVTYNEATIYNPATTTSPKETPEIAQFWREYTSSNEKIMVLKKYSAPYSPSFSSRFKSLIKRVLKHLSK